MVNTDRYGSLADGLDKIGGDVIGVDVRAITQNFIIANSEIAIDCNGEHTGIFYVSGSFTGTLVAEISVDGTNFIAIPIWSLASELFSASIASGGYYQFDIPAGTRRARVRASALSAGTAVVAMRATKAMDFVYAKPIPTTATLTATAGVGSAATLSIPAPGNGLYHYITRVRISKYVAATLTAAVTPTIVTSTNIINTPSFDFKTLGSLGDSEVLDIDFTGNPLKSLVANSGTTFVAPILAGAIWKITAFYYIGA